MPLASSVMIQLAVLGALLVLGGAAGRPLARQLRRLSHDGTGVPAGFTLALGLAAIAQVLLLLGLVGGLTKTGLTPLLVLLGLLARPVLGAMELRPALASVSGVALGLAATSAFVLTLYPPLGFDQTLYHLPYAQAFAATGGVPFLPDLRFPVFPQLAELLTTPVLLFVDAEATQLVGLAALLAAAALAWAWVREMAPESHGAGAWLAPAMLLGSPAALYLGMCGYVEPVLALFGLGALYAAWRSRRDASLGWAVAAGFLAGSAAGVKYLGLLFVVAAAGLFSLREPRRTLVVRLGGFSLAALLALAPSYGRILALTGNPLFPFFPQLFGDSPWAGNEFLAEFGPSQLARAATLLWDITFDRQAVGGLPPFSPAFALGLPLVALAVVRRPAARSLFRVSLVCLLLAPTNAHYFLGFAPLWCVLVAAGADELARSHLGWRRWLTAVAILVTLGGPAWAAHRFLVLGPPPTTVEEREAFLARHLPLYPAVAFLNREAAGAPVYGVTAESMVAYSRGPLLGDVNGPFSYGRMASRADEIGVAAALDEIGVRYLLVNRRVSGWTDRTEWDPGLERIYENEAAVVFRRAASKTFSPLP